MNVTSLATSLARRCRIAASATATNGSSSWALPVQVQRAAPTPTPTHHGRSMTSLATIQNNRFAVSSSKLLSGSSSSSSVAATRTWNFHSLAITPKTNITTLSPSTYPTYPSYPSSSIAKVQTRTMATKKHKRIIKMAKGYRGRAKNTFRAAIRRVEKGLQYAYRDRKVRKRNFRKLWIERVNAGVRQHGMSYSRFINGMVNMNGTARDDRDGGKKIVLNRKVLADLAANEPFSFKAVVDVVKMNNAAK